MGRTKFVSERRRVHKQGRVFLYRILAHKGQVDLLVFNMSQGI